MPTKTWCTNQTSAKILCDSSALNIISNFTKEKGCFIFAKVYITVQMEKQTAILGQASAATDKSNLLFFLS